MLVLIAFHLLTLLPRLNSAIPSGITGKLTLNERLNGTINGLKLSRINLTAQDPDLQNFPVSCFTRPNLEPLPKSLRKALAADCYHILYHMIAPLSYVLSEVEFGNVQYRNRAGNVLPAKWEHRKCTIIVSSLFSDERTYMSLMEVVLTAQKVLTTCVVNGKQQWGGINHVGSIVKSFYVSLLGPPLEHESVTALGFNNSDNPNLDVSKRYTKPASLGPEDR